MNERQSWKRHIPGYIGGVILASIIGYLLSFAVAAPDPGATKVQGSDQQGSPVNTQIVGDSVAGTFKTAITASATGAASAANSTLSGVPNKTTYITGFQVTGAGATAASVVNVTVTGTVTGTLTYNVVVPAGATTSITPLVVTFPNPVPASGANTSIVVNVPSFGAGNTNSASAAQGFQQ